MDIKVKPKAVESTMTASKKLKECITIGHHVADGEEEDITQKGQQTMKIMDSFTLNQFRQVECKNDSRSSYSSSSSTSPSSSLEMMKNLEIDKNEKSRPKKEEEIKDISNMKKHKKTTSLVWDCGSTLYDSFELNSFKRQLDSAIASSARTMSMSHLPDRCLPSLNSPETPPLPTTSSSTGKKHSNKISRSLHRFLKSVFRPKHHQQSLSTPSSPVYKSIGRGGVGDKDRFYVVYDKSGSLTTIPESTEKEEINSLVRKTVSERFSASRVVGISCA